MGASGHSRTRTTVLVVCALMMFVVIDIGFRLFGFLTVTRALVGSARRIGKLKHSHEDSLSDGRSTFDAVCVATRYYYRRRLDCLPKALTTHCLLLAQGVAAELCLGVKRWPFAGHAWVQVAGHQLDDSPSLLYHSGTYVVVEKF